MSDQPWDGMCTVTQPGTGKPCLLAAGHRGMHKAGKSVNERWGGKFTKPARTGGPSLSREEPATKFRDIPGQGAMDLETGDVVWEDGDE